MSNPFDHNFFKFVTGFVCILVASFGVLYFVGTYSQSSEKQVAVMDGK